jgi:hypothetical protein
VYTTHEWVPMEQVFEHGNKSRWLVLLLRQV